MESLDLALQILSSYGCDLKSGLTNHAPMVAESLDYLGRTAEILPWVTAELDHIRQRPARSSPVDAGNWQSALGHPERFSDWVDYFRNEMQAAGWQSVVAKWADRLAPGFATSATHSVIRTGHAVRSITRKQTGERTAELADGLSSWASQYLELDAAPSSKRLHPAEALQQVALVSSAHHAPRGAITDAVSRLSHYPQFAPVAYWLDTSIPLEEIGGVFARLFVQSANSFVGGIVFTHAITGLAAARNLDRSVPAATGVKLKRFAWQAGAALHAVYSEQPYQHKSSNDQRPEPGNLVDAALRNGDEHVIKLTEACVTLYEATSDKHFLLAAARGQALITPRAR